LKLYSYWRSSSAWRVRIALGWKNIACDIVPVHLLNDGGEQHRPEFLARNPLAQVPVLEAEGVGGIFLLTQSMAILEYLEERFPEPPLLPRDPELRARARQFAEVVNSGIQPLQNLSERLARGPVVSRTHFARFLVEQGYVRGMQQAFKQFLSSGKPGHVGWRLLVVSKLLSGNLCRYQVTDTRCCVLRL